MEANGLELRVLMTLTPSMDVVVDGHATLDRSEKPLHLTLGVSARFTGRQFPGSDVMECGGRMALHWLSSVE